MMMMVVMVVIMVMMVEVMIDLLQGFGDQDRALATQGLASPSVRTLDNDYVKVGSISGSEAGVPFPVADGSGHAAAGGGGGGGRAVLRLCKAPAEAPAEARQHLICDVSSNLYPLTPDP